MNLQIIINILLVAVLLMTVYFVTEKASCSIDDIQTALADMEIMVELG